MRNSRWPMAVLLSALVAVTPGCTAFNSSASGDAPEPAGPPPAEVVTSAPQERLTLVADGDPVSAAVSMSRALFDDAPVVVLARDGDRSGTLLAASAAVALGVPVLVQPADEGATSDAVDTELNRLGTEAVLAVGEAGGTGGEGDGGPAIVTIPTEVGALSETTGLEFSDTTEVGADDDAAAVAGLDGADPAALVPDSAAAPSGKQGDAGELPAIERADPLTDTVVLGTGEPGSAAALATARAAGAQVVLTDGQTDPRGSADALDALAASDVGSVVALGAGFAAEQGLDWKLATATKGEQLPGGGQLLFPDRMLVALYGHPGTGALGVLGEQGLEASIERARAHAAPYEPLVDVPVVPAFEIIATVASSSPGPDGNYSSESDPEELRPWVEAAGKAGVYVVLDLQPGRTDFLTQAKGYRSLLELPNVGLALDPEWRLGPDQVHLTQIGSVGIEEVNEVVSWLADLTREGALPQKLLVLHQFRVDMLPGRERLDTSRDELAITIHADGQGSQGDKQATWRALHQNVPEGVWWGWKNFYDEDVPMLTPGQTVDQVDPRPDLVSYQ